MPIDFSQKTLIIFDFDGTLMDSVGLIVDSMAYSAKLHGLTVSETATKSIIGIALVEAIAMLFPDNPEKHEQIFASYADYYVKHCENDKPFVGILPLLQQLQQQNKILAIATGKKRVGLERHFEISGLKPFFSISRCADETAGKPNPLMLEEILAETDKSLAEAVMIGDSVHDIRMANNLGMDSIAVSYGCETADNLAKENPTIIVETVAQLQKILA